MTGVYCCKLLGDGIMNNLHRAVINGERLKAARELIGLTQQEVAARVGVNKQTISSYENDHGKPSVDVFLRLCVLYNLDARNLIMTVSNN
jgi:transcriptional regulator with XRE-family HTH domain